MLVQKAFWEKSKKKKPQKIFTGEGENQTENQEQKY